MNGMKRWHKLSLALRGSRATGRSTCSKCWRQALANHNPDTNAPYQQLLKGDPRFASEISFSRFLNFCGISFHDCRALREFLYSDRSIQP